MQHNVTGLKYFCKTACLNKINRYKGSGIYWVKHLKKHGKDVTVGVLGFYIDKDRCLAAAKKFSVDNNIVEDDAWANLVEETGMNGASLKGERNPFYGKKHTPETAERLRLRKIGRSVNKGAYRSPEQRKKISDALKGIAKPNISEKLKGRIFTAKHRANISAGNKGKKISEETKEKIRQASLKQWERYRKQKQNLPPDEVTE